MRSEKCESFRSENPLSQSNKLKARAFIIAISVAAIDCTYLVSSHPHSSKFSFPIQ
jgi:hypothetical protein